MTRRIAIVCVSLLMSLLQSGAFGTFEFRENDDGTLIIKKYRASNSRSKNEHFDIPGKVGDKPVTKLAYWAFANRKMESVAIPKSVTVIADGCFHNCKFLKELDIPPKVKSIGKGAFRNCNCLESVSIPDSVILIGDEAFDECPRLKAVFIPSKIEEIGDRAFGASEIECAIFRGDAPSTFGRSPFGAFRNNFIVAYHEGSKGFTKPTWNGYRSIEIPKGSHFLMVVDGTGKGIYDGGEKVEIEAQPPLGTGFKKWVGNADGCADIAAYKTEFLMPGTNVVIRAEFVNIPDSDWEIEEQDDGTVRILAYRGALEKVTKPATVGGKTVRHKRFSSNEEQWEYMAKRILAGDQIPNSWREECHKQFLEYFKRNCEENKAENLYGFSDKSNAKHYVNAMKLSAIHPNHAGWPIRHPGRRKAYKLIKKWLDNNPDQLDLLVGIIIPAIENDETKIAVAAYKKLEKVDKDWAAYIQNLVLHYYKNSPAAKGILE